MAAMLGNASPRKPSVERLFKSSGLTSLLVAWRANASSISGSAIPVPLSVIRIDPIPPC